MAEDELVTLLHGIRDRADELDLSQDECDALDRAAELLGPEPLLDEQAAHPPVSPIRSGWEDETKRRNLGF